jgi:hypothetical protein
MIILQKDCEFFFSLFIYFYMKIFLNEIFYNLLLKIHIVVIDHMFCVNHC